MILFIICTGSLSKGSDENVRSLIEAGLIQVLLKIITNPATDEHLIEICLCVVRSIYEHPFAPKEIINTTSTLSYLIGKLKHLRHFLILTKTANFIVFIKIKLYVFYHILKYSLFSVFFFSDFKQV